MSLTEALPGYSPEEKIQIQFQKHLVYKVIEWFLWGLILLTPVLILVVTSVAGGAPFSEPARNYVVVFGALYYLSMLNFIFLRWMTMKLSLTIVTDKRVVAIRQHGMLQREIKEYAWEKIEEIAVDKHGFLQTFFGIGNIKVTSTQEEFEIRGVPDPVASLGKMRELRELADSDSDEHPAPPKETKEALENLKAAAETMKETAEELAKKPKKEQPVAAEPIAKVADKIESEIKKAEKRR